MRSGMVDAAPLMLAIAPFATAMAVAAHSAGLRGVETVAMSIFVFAGAAQMAAISLYAGGAGVVAIGLTTLLINLRHIIYGLALDRVLPEATRPSRPILAFLLIDEAFGFTASRIHTVHRPDAYFVGVALGIYIPFVFFTAIGAMFAAAIPDIDRLGLENIFPLAFISFLMPLLVNAKPVAIALASGGLMLILPRFIDSGLAILLAISGGALVGAFWEDDQ
jgi:4-azaleucine resistance transporter AzlC